VRVAPRLFARRANLAYAKGPASIAIRGALDPAIYPSDERWLLSPARASIASFVPHYRFRIGSGQLEEQIVCLKLYHPICDHNCLQLFDDLDGRGAITSLHPPLHSSYSSVLSVSRLWFLFFSFLFCVSNIKLLSFFSGHLSLPWYCGIVGEFCRYLACFL